MSLRNGDTYEGYFEYDKMHDEKGKMTKDNGDTYEGTFEDDKMQGRIKMTKKNGDTYEGIFTDDILQSIVKMTKKNGDTYEGTFADEKRNGKGTFTWVLIGEKYIGDWVNGKMHG